MPRRNANLTSGAALTCVFLVLGFVTGAAAEPESLRLGGELRVHSPVYPALGADTSLDLIAGLGSLELLSRTDLALVPYTMAEETLSLALVRDWLCLRAEYRFSVLPIGITSATLVVRAVPPHVVLDDGQRKTDFWIEGEARQKGDSWGRFPERTEIWAKGSAVLTLTDTFVDALTLGASVTATASDPHGERVWWTGAFLFGGRLGAASLESETGFSITPVRLESLKVTLSSGTGPYGLSAYGRVSFASPSCLPVLEVGVALAFGAPSLQAPTQGSCSGGVCTDW